jgi:acetyl-CoA carboxylase biotin carboxyl carrier protein
MPQKPRSPSPPRRMDVKEIQALVRLMVENDLGEVEIADGPVRVHLKRQGGAPPAGAGSPSGTAATPTVPSAPAPPAEELLEIRSPMVGTFYSAPSPESEPFVQEGSAIREDTVVCIVEAMKVMNEVKAECSGVVREVCVRNAQPVEFGQLLFRVRPS